MFRSCDRAEVRFEGGRADSAAGVMEASARSALGAVCEEMRAHTHLGEGDHCLLLLPLFGEDVVGELNGPLLPWSTVGRTTSDGQHKVDSFRFRACACLAPSDLSSHMPVLATIRTPREGGSIWMGWRANGVVGMQGNGKMRNRLGFGQKPRPINLSVYLEDPTLSCMRIHAVGVCG